MKKKDKGANTGLARPSWERALERDDCPYISEMAAEGRISRFVYAVAAGVKERDCWDHAVMWPTRLELGAMLMHEEVGPMLERAWLASRRDDLATGLKIAAENGNRDAAAALAEWLSRGGVRLSREDAALPSGEFVVEGSGF